MMWDPAESERREELEPVYYDVPAHLKAELWDWTDSRLHTKVAAGTTHPTLIVMTGLRVDISSMPSGGLYGRLQSELKAMCFARPEVQLEAIRILLRDLPNPTAADDLERRLKRGRSGYAVRLDKDGLEFRVAPAMREQIENAVTTTRDSVSQRLAKAWNEAYGIDGHADAAWDAAIKATEAAVRPIVTPSDANAGLGKLIRVFEDSPQKWSLVIEESRATFDPNKHTKLDGAETVVQMMRTIAFGQKARHGQDDANSLASARAAVQLAVTVAMLCETGSFARRDASR